MEVRYYFKMPVSVDTVQYFLHIAKVDEETDNAVEDIIKKFACNEQAATDYLEEANIDTNEWL